MSNYAPQDARITILFQRRKIGGPQQQGMLMSDGNVYVLDRLPYYRVEFDVDVAGIPTSYFEPISERAGTINSSDTDFPSPYSYPIKGIEIWDGQQSETFRFFTGV